MSDMKVGEQTVRLNDNGSEELADGFVDHGSVGFVIGTRGWVAAEDGEGRDVVLMWLREGATRDGWLGVLNIDTGEYDEFTPIDGSIAGPYTSLLSSDGQYYACNRHFVMFNPARPGFDVINENVNEGEALAMSMTEDDAGVIWAACYPNMTVVRYDPGNGAYDEYFDLYEHPSQLYPRSMAADDRGWVYVAVNPVAGQFLIFDPDDEAIEPVLPEDERVTEGEIEVVRDLNGRVYGRANERWFTFHDGETEELTTAPEIDEAPIVTGPQSLAHRDLPSGNRIARLDVRTTRPHVIVEVPETGDREVVTFEPSGGDAVPMGLTLAPDDTIVGGTYIPHQFFRFEPDEDSWFKGINVGQWNVLTTTENGVYVGVYPDGALCMWDPDASWDTPDERTRDLDSNPRYLYNDTRHLHRPYSMLTHPNGRYIVLSGTPDYGHTGGGLLFWDRTNEAAEVLTHEDVVPWHVTESMVALPNGDLLGGTTTRPALGGVRRADEATLYVLDVHEKEVVWTGALLDGVVSYQDMCITDDGTVFGVADRERLFVFDPTGREIEHETTLNEVTANQQGSEVFVQTPGGRVFLLFQSGTIAEIDTESYEITPRATAPADIGNGGTFYNGRIYFATNSNLFSWEVSGPEDQS